MSGQSAYRGPSHKSECSVKAVYRRVSFDEECSCIGACVGKPNPQTHPGHDNHRDTRSRISLTVLSLWSELLTTYCSVLEERERESERERERERERGREREREGERERARERERERARERARERERERERARERWKKK